MTATATPPARNTVELGEGVVVQNPQLIELRCSQILKNATTQALRDPVTTSTDFAKLKESIRQPRFVEQQDPTTGNIIRKQVAPHGLLNPISVRPIPGNSAQFALIDGGHRYAAWLELFGDAVPIPAYCINMTDVQAMEAQIEGNFHVKKTKPAEYSRQILRLLTAFPLRTIEDQADRLHMDAATLKQWLGLTNLTGLKYIEKENGQKVSAIQEAVDNGGLKLSAAFVISTAHDGVPTRKQFWAEKQQEYFEAALAAQDTPQGVARFCAETTQAIKELKKILKAGGDPALAPSDTPVPVSRKISEMKVEVARTAELVAANRANADLQKQITELASTYPEACAAINSMGYLGGLEFAVQIDSETVERKKQEKAQALAARKEASEERKAGTKATTVARSTGMFGRRL